MRLKERKNLKLEKDLKISLLKNTIEKDKQKNQNKVTIFHILNLFKFI